jgi:hypothetical protein
MDRAMMLRTTSELQATATVLVMLDLIAEDRAEEILQAQGRSLDELGISEQGVSIGELTLRPTSAHGFQAARRRPFESLLHRPASVAVSGARMSFLDFDLGIDWLVVAPGGVRGRGTIRTGDGRLLPTRGPEVSIPCVDDNGRRHELQFTGGQVRVRVIPAPPATNASTSAEITTDSPIDPSARWLELQPPGSSSLRIELRPPEAVLSGQAEPDWATPAEWFLAALLPDTHGAEPEATFGIGLDAAAARAVGAAVADALLAVGALPPGSPLLHRYPEGSSRWTSDLAQLYTERVAPSWATAARPRQVIASGVPLPLKQAVAVLEAVVVMDDNVWLHAYLFPDTTGEYWPVSPGVMHVSATDDLGHQHAAIPASCWALPEHEGFGDLWLWPPLDPRARRLRFTVSTPWEAAWTEITLPER